MHKKHIVAAFAFIVLVWVLYEHHQTTGKAKHEAKVEAGSLVSSGSDSGITRPALPAKGTLEEQASCAKQSKVYFDQWVRDSPAQSVGYSQNFSNHYDAQTRTCYVEIVNWGAKVGREFANSKFLADAYEGSEIADYYWLSKAGHKYWDVPPQQCEVKDQNGAMTHCDSDDSFKELVLHRYGISE